MEEMMNDYIEKAMESVSLVEKDLKYEVAKEKTYIRNQIDPEKISRIPAKILSRPDVPLQNLPDIT